jgi:hypothetical protein
LRRVAERFLKVAVVPYGHWALGMRNTNNLQPGAGAASRQPPAPPVHCALGAWSLELRLGPMSREHARPQLPAGCRRYGGGAGAGEPAPVPAGSPATKPSGPGAELDPPDHTQAAGGPSSPLDPGGERWPIPRLLALVIAHLVFLCPAGGGVEVLLDEALR